MLIPTKLLAIACAIKTAAVCYYDILNYKSHITEIVDILQLTDKVDHFVNMLRNDGGSGVCSARSRLTNKTYAHRLMELYSSLHMSAGSPQEWSI